MPAATSRTIRSALGEFAFRRAFARFRRDPLARAADPETLARLVHAWGNEAWSADAEYLRRVVECVSARAGATVLECGSGLSTLVLGAVAERTGSRVYSLEHDATWRARVSTALVRHGIGAATVCAAPIVDQGDFDWYAPSAEVRAERFDIVVCDGPPGETRGGRYGLIPVMQHSLTAGCVVLLDDAHRASERGVLQRWTHEFGGPVEISSAGKQVGEYRFPGPKP